MNDRDTTFDELRQRVIDLCREKEWGEDGIQNPQHVAMAMTVEMSELLEHFQWLDEDDVRSLMNGGDEKERSQIAEEFADVMMYGLQIGRAHV